MNRCTTTIDTKKTKRGRFIAVVIESVNRKLFEYTTPDFDTAHAAYRDAVRRIHKRHWKVLDSGTTEFVKD